MFTNVRVRRILITGLAILSFALGIIVILIPSPDLSTENDLRHQLALLSTKVQQAERINVDRKDDLQRLFFQFSELSKLLMDQKVENQRQDGKKDRSDIVRKLEPLFNGRALSFEGEALLKGQNWTYDLSLPSIRYSLPHLVHQPRSLSPAFKLSQGRTQVRGQKLSVMTLCVSFMIFSLIFCRFQWF